MAKDSTGQRGTPETRRKPLTIDLPAEEVARKEAEGVAAAAGGAQAAAEDKAAMEAMRERKRETSAPKSGERGKPTETITPSALAQPTRAEKASASREPPREASRPSFVSHVLAAIIGGAVVALVVAILALAGVFLPPREEGPDIAGALAPLESEIAALKAEIGALGEAPADDPLAPLREQLATLQQSVGALESAAPENADEEALREIQTRLEQLEASVAQTAAGVPSDEAGAKLTARLNELSAEIDALKSVPAPDLSGLESGLAEIRQGLAALAAEAKTLPREDRIASIEAKLSEVEQKIEKAAALGPAVAADALAAALDTGRPFASELVALEALGVGTDAVAALRPSAETGLPTLGEIRSRFETEMAAVDLSQPTAEGTGPLDRLLESARGLVEVRPAKPTAGADPGAVAARTRGALSAGDLKAALAEWETLPEDVRSATASWAETVRTRVAADDLVARLRGEALSRLDNEG
ncbi:MAG: hypothetical protein ACRED5_07325 [Propylenella sp.]